MRRGERRLQGGDEMRALPVLFLCLRYTQLICLSLFPSIRYSELRMDHFQVVDVYLCATLPSQNAEAILLQLFGLLPSQSATSNIAIPCRLLTKGTVRIVFPLGALSFRSSSLRTFPSLSELGRVGERERCGLRRP